MQTLKNDIPRHEYVPSLLFSPRLPDENREEYKLRRKANKEDLSEYLSGRFIERKAPSTRFIKKLWKGKRTLNSLRKAKKDYMKRIIGLDDISLVVMEYLGKANKQVSRDSFFSDLITVKTMQQERLLDKYDSE